MLTCLFETKIVHHCAFDVGFAKVQRTDFGFFGGSKISVMLERSNDVYSANIDILKVFSSIFAASKLQ